MRHKNGKFPFYYKQHWKVLYLYTPKKTKPKQIMPKISSWRFLSVTFALILSVSFEVSTKKSVAEDIKSCR